MIKQLSIKNLLLIKKITLNFTSGLCVLTGETGAGKSMILDSLNLLSGNRLRSNFKPENDQKVEITALIDISKFESACKLINDLDIEFESEIIAKRTIDNNGKSRCFINDNIVTLSTFKLIISDILEIHSQFSEQGLLDSNSHISILDNYGNYEEKLHHLDEIWKNLKKAELDYEEFKEKSQNQKSIVEALNFDLDQLKSVNPQKEEFEKLVKKQKILKNSEKISQNLNHVINNFNSESPPGIDILMTDTIKNLEKIKDLLDEKIKERINNLNSAFLDIQDTMTDLQGLLDESFDLASLEKIEDRIQIFKRISRKHNFEENKLIDLLSILESRLEHNQNFDNILDIKRKKFEDIQFHYNDISKEISLLRKKFAQNLDEEINKEFPSLKLENAKFQTFIEEIEANKRGIDKILFKIRTNPKSKMDEIKKISSGGELCRIALAIKVIAEKGNSSTMVFDEVDSGIGGAVSSAVGERLKKLADSRQVIVVTHSPQVAAFGKDHFTVQKISTEDDTKININKINFDEKINEVARMLSGKHITKEAISAARKLIDN
jgi:DNA repair protein RecN (Recombination protein N)